MSRSGSKRCYDHRLRAAVVRVGGVAPAGRLDIPRSTVATWLARGPANVVTLAADDETDLAAEVLKLRRRVRILGTVVGLQKQIISQSGFSFEHARVPDAVAKGAILTAIGRATKVLPLMSVLRVLGIT